MSIRCCGVQRKTGPGLPNGKPAGVRCVYLLHQNLSKLDAPPGCLAILQLIQAVGGDLQGYVIMLSRA